MHKYVSLLACLMICTFSVVGCSGSSSAPSSGLTPMPLHHDLGDEKVTEAVTKFLSSQNAPAYSAYDMARVDLNSDGMRDALVLFKLPHSYWCGWDGCGLLILKSGAESFTPVNTINSVRGPLYVTDKLSNGWKDIIIRISGSTISDKNVIVSFDGHAYPSSPLLGKDFIPPISTVNTQEFFK